MFGWSKKDAVQGDSAPIKDAERRISDNHSEIQRLSIQIEGIGLRMNQVIAAVNTGMERTEAAAKRARTSQSNAERAEKRRGDYEIEEAPEVQAPAQHGSLTIVEGAEFAT